MGCKLEACPACAGEAEANYWQAIMEAILNPC
jgi:hypothetical protein